jgi:replicative DNA helicase
VSDFLEGVPLTSSIEAEMSVLGSMILSRKAASGMATYLKTWDFYRPAHRWIFETMKQMVVAGQEIDLVTLRAKLIEKGKLADCGGVDFLVELAEYVPSAANAIDYAKLIRDRAIRRKMHKLSRSVVDLATNGEKPTDQILLEVKGLLREIEEEEALGKSRLISIGEVVREIVDGYQDEDSPSALLSQVMVPTGIASLDRYNVLKRGGMMIVAGRPGMGKSSLGMTVASNIAEQGKNVVIVSYEMPPVQLVRRLLAANAGLSVKALSSKEAFLKIADLDTHLKLQDGAEAIFHRTVYFVDKPSKKWSELEVQLLQAQAQLGRIDCLVIDYLQLMAQGTQYQAAEISHAANWMKGFCMEHDIAGIGLAQLKRDAAGTSKKPTIEDLKGSSGLEEAADSVVLIYRDSYQGEKRVDPSQPQEVDLIIGKNRDGESGVTARAYFIPEQTAFRSA